MTNGTAEQFAAVWRNGLYGGFSRGTDGQNTTPFLEMLIKRLENEFTLPHVVEGGSGSGDHAITLAQRGMRVTAVEYSPDAVEQFRDVLAAHPCSYRGRIEVVQGDLLEYLRQAKGRISAFYANSVLHFFGQEERQEVYGLLGGRQFPGGLIAVSFKAEGDILQGRGDVLEENEAGVLVKSTEDGITKKAGITRLFVRNPEPLAREITGAGYALDTVCRWDVQGYNYQGEVSKFIGLLAVRR